MDLSAGTWQHLLLIAGVFLAVALCAFALIAACGLLAHQAQRKALRRKRTDAPLPTARPCKPAEKEVS